MRISLTLRTNTPRPLSVHVHELLIFKTDRVIASAAVHSTQSINVIDNNQHPNIVQYLSYCFPPHCVADWHTLQEFMTIGILSYSECGSSEYPLHSPHHCKHNVLIHRRTSDLSSGQFGRSLRQFFWGCTAVGPWRSATRVNCALD